MTFIRNMNSSIKYENHKIVFYKTLYLTYERKPLGKGKDKSS